MNAQLNKDSISVIKEIPPDLPPIFANFQKIEQVFLNIISNARYALNQKYNVTHQDKIFIITAEKAVIDEQPYVRIYFHDNGNGIHEDDLESVMNPFYSTKPLGEGTGLGLSISHGIILNHGGNINIESSFGDNTKIILNLPCKRGR